MLFRGNFMGWFAAPVTLCLLCDDVAFSGDDSVC